jgi:hypothetical protein
MVSSGVFGFSSGHLALVPAKPATQNSKTDTQKPLTTEATKEHEVKESLQCCTIKDLKNGVFPQTFFRLLTKLQFFSAGFCALRELCGEL